jgi:hypothetical protein
MIYYIESKRRASPKARIKSSSLDIIYNENNAKIISACGKKYRLIIDESEF